MRRIVDHAAAYLAVPPTRIVYLYKYERPNFDLFDGRVDLIQWTRAEGRRLVDVVEEAVFDSDEPTVVILDDVQTVTNSRIV